MIIHSLTLSLNMYVYQLWDGYYAKARCWLGTDKFLLKYGFPNSCLVFSTFVYNSFSAFVFFFLNRAESILQSLLFLILWFFHKAYISDDSSDNEKYLAKKKKWYLTVYLHLRRWSISKCYDLDNKGEVPLPLGCDRICKLKIVNLYLDLPIPTPPIPGSKQGLPHRIPIPAIRKCKAWQESRSIAICWVNKWTFSPI